LTRVLLRMKDLRRYEIKNHPTLARWIKEKEFPNGFYLGSNTRVWYEDDCDEWLANRSNADPPPIVKGPGAVPPAPEARKPKPPLSPTKIRESAPACQAFPNRRASA
jgi:predicted DNA-binding transcriptional regulator AlpA